MPVTEPDVPFEAAAPFTPLPPIQEVPIERPVILGRTPPHSIEAEEYLLSTCLLDDGVTLDRCVERSVSPFDFYSPANRLIYETLCRMRTEHKVIETAVLAEELQTSKQLESVGGFAFITYVSSRIGTTAQAAYFIEKVRELSLVRETITAAIGTAEAGFAYHGDINEFLTMARARLPSPDRIRGKGTAYTVWQPAAFRLWEPPLNINLVGGGYLRRRQLTTLIGPPGVGKSRLSLWLGCSHICGREFVGLNCYNGPAKWLFFGNENDPLRQKTDLAWFYKNLLKEEQDRVDAHLYLHVIDKPDDGIITLADPEAFAKLVSTLRQIVPDVVVFDPWGNMIEGNENDNEEVRKTLKLLLRAVNQTCPDAAILVIHHARTGRATAIEAGNNYSGGSLGRGSKALVSSARCELALWPGDSEDSSRLVLTCEKANNVEKFEPKGLIFDNGIFRVDGEFSVNAWKDDIEGTRGGKTLTIHDLVEIVNDGLAKTEAIVDRVQEDFGLSRSTCYQRLREAVAKGYLEKTMPSGSYTLGNRRIVAASPPKPAAASPLPPEQPELL